jgi:phage replication O-like protein O
MKELHGAAFKVISAITRKTFGWNKDKDKISLNQISEITGLSRTQIKKAIKELETTDLILCDRNNKSATCFEIKIKGSRKTTPTRSESDSPRSESGPDALKSGAESDPTKETIKETKPKEKHDAPPSINEVELYLDTLHIITFTAQSFIDYYQARGWMIGKNKMKDWQAAVRTWKNRQQEKPKEKSYADQLKEQYGN